MKVDIHIVTREGTKGKTYRRDVCAGMITIPDDSDFQVHILTERGEWKKGDSSCFRGHRKPQKVVDQEIQEKEV